jgi:hypothetical protein
LGAPSRAILTISGCSRTSPESAAVIQELLGQRQDQAPDFLKAAGRQATQGYKEGILGAQRGSLGVNGDAGCNGGGFRYSS